MKAGALLAESASLPRLLTAALEQSPDGIAITDLKGKLLYGNLALAKLHGCKPSDLSGTCSLFTSASAELRQLNMSINGRQETDVVTGEVQIVRHEGDTARAWLQQVLLKDISGKPLGILHTLREIPAGNVYPWPDDALKYTDDLIQANRRLKQALRKCRRIEPKPANRKAEARVRVAPLSEM
jgi:PAS domain S-box-containing protein